MTAAQQTAVQRYEYEQAMDISRVRWLSEQGWRLHSAVPCGGNVWYIMERPAGGAVQTEPRFDDRPTHSDGSGDPVGDATDAQYQQARRAGHSPRCAAQVVRHVPCGCLTRTEAAR